MLRKIISGGQTGVDRIGLEVAKELGFQTGGTAQKNFMTENGADLTLMDFGLVESWSTLPQIRTMQNVRDADATVIFGNTLSAGSICAKKACADNSKPYKENPTPEQLAKFIEEYNIRVLNIAGNRGSKLSSSQATAIRFQITTGLKLVKHAN